MVSPDLKDYKEWAEHISINNLFTDLHEFETFGYNYVGHNIAEGHRTQAVESFLLDKTAKPFGRWNKNPDLKVDLKKPEYLGEKDSSKDYNYCTHVREQMKHQVKLENELRAVEHGPSGSGASCGHSQETIQEELYNRSRSYLRRMFELIFISKGTLVEQEEEQKEKVVLVSAQREEPYYKKQQSESSSEMGPVYKTKGVHQQLQKIQPPILFQTLVDRVPPLPQIQIPERLPQPFRRFRLLE